MKRLWMLVVVFVLLCPSVLAKAKREDKKGDDTKAKLSAATFAGVKLRNIGPAINSGRVSDLAAKPLVCKNNEQVPVVIKLVIDAQADERIYAA